MEITYMSEGKHGSCSYALQCFLKKDERLGGQSSEALGRILEVWAMNSHNVTSFSGDEKLR